jgi:hypothetical protein
MIGDFAEALREGVVAPLDQAKAAIRGLEDADRVRYSGYPSSRDRQVVVIRDAAIVVSFEFVTFDGEEWVAASANACDGTEIKPR